MEEERREKTFERGAKNKTLKKSKPKPDQTLQPGFAATRGENKQEGAEDEKLPGALGQ